MSNDCGEYTLWEVKINVAITIATHCVYVDGTGIE